MKISELHRKSLDLRLELGDTVNLLYDNGASVPVVFRKILFKDGGHPSLQFSNFDYVCLSGCTMCYFGSGRAGNFDSDLNFVDIERWKPTSDEDIEKVRLIREDLKNKTYNYIR